MFYSLIVLCFFNLGCWKCIYVYNTLKLVSCSFLQTIVLKILILIIEILCIELKPNFLTNFENQLIKSTQNCPFAVKYSTQKWKCWSQQSNWKCYWISSTSNFCGTKHKSKWKRTAESIANRKIFVLWNVYRTGTKIIYGLATRNFWKFLFRANSN